MMLSLNDVQDQIDSMIQNSTPPQDTMNVAGARGWASLSGVSVSEVFAAVWAHKLLIFIVFILVFAASMAGVLTLEKTYTAKGRILVQFGEEYIYDPIVGTAGQGTAYSADQMIQAEIGFITAVELKEKVLNRIGLRRLYPKLAVEFESRPQRRALILGAALHNLDKDLGTFTAPNQPLVTITFRHTNPQIAKDVLAAFIEEYQIYRREILSDSTNGGVEEERASSEAALREVNEELELFLGQNGIGDFVAERAALGVRIAVLRDQLLSAQTRRKEIEGALLITGTHLAQTPETIEQFTDDASSGQLADLKVQREQLLAKYLPNSSPVKEIDARINRLERYLQSGAGQSTGTKRTGVNAIYQGLQTSKLALQTEQRSNGARIKILKSQITAIKAGQRRFQKLFPEYQRLANQALIMETNYVQFATREQELKTRRNLATLKSDNIRVIERPTVPVAGKSMKKPAAVLAFLFAVFTALSTGLFFALRALVKKTGQVDVVAKPRRAAPSPPHHNRRRSAPPPAGHVDPSFLVLQTPGMTAVDDLPVLGNISTRT